VAALLAPSVIALISLTSLQQRLAWSESRLDLTYGALFHVQHALLTIGVVAGLASVALALYHRKWLRRVLHLALICSLVDLFYRLAYDGALSSGVLLAMTETSGRETGELLAGHAILTVSLTLMALLALYAVKVAWNADIRFPMNRCLQTGALSLSMIIASMAIGWQQLGDTRLLKLVVLAEVKDTFPFDIASAFASVATGLIDTHRLAPVRAGFKFPNVSRVNAVSRDAAPEIYVIVIGETSRRINWSLFGYSRTTTPRLDAIRDDLVLFPHVTSNATNTILSVPLALTRAAPATRRIVRSEKSIISLLKQAGFETFWISNQERSDAFSNPISQIALEADHASFTEDMEPSRRADGFDSNLLTRMDDVLAHFPKNGKAVLFLHMEGSHFGYKERYPANFEHFRSGRGAPRTLPDWPMRVLDEYDNSVYFTDYIVREVIRKLSRCGCRAGLVFFSDHGERLFDNDFSDDFGHGFPTISREEIEVPFFIWLSSAYQVANPVLVTRLKANTQSIAQLDNLFETMVDLTGVDYRNRAAAVSLFSDQLQSPARLDVLDIAEEAVSLPVEESRTLVTLRRPVAPAAMSTAPLP
jgi:glucan phosphoethanolaminetransferase (alkaline phosphatase superfamily)